MCFSAEASFGASAVISVIGIVAVKKSTTVPQKILSCIPLIFAAQQFAEGILWLSLSHTSLAQWNKPATYTFLTAAEVAWPIMLPLSVMLLEKQKVRKRILAVFLVLGILVSSILGYCLVVYPVQSSISCSHILYDVSYPIHTPYFAPFYLIASVVPPFISSIKRVLLLGALLTVSYIVTTIFYEDYLISVWCFFSAAISLLILSNIIYFNRPAKLSPGAMPGVV